MNTPVHLNPTLRRVLRALTIPLHLMGGAVVVLAADSRDTAAPKNPERAAPAAISRSESDTTDDAARSEKDVVQLSPFVVTSERDSGYQATSTLAGTRLNTPIRDLGAAISIYTKDFLNDIGATNANELLIYATGMEASGAGGNFSGAADSVSSVEVVGNASRVEPQQSSRARGLAAPNFTRGYFGTNIAFDSYNTDTVTVSRGPNAALFGVGSPAGVVDTSLLQADVHRNRNKLVVRYGNNDAFRQTLDINRVLVPNKLALRIAALNDAERFNQRPAYEDKKRIYGALTFEPFKATSLRANFESGKTRANRPITVLPFNGISAPWLAAGRPAYDWSYYDDPARNPSASSITSQYAPLLGQAQLFNQVVVVYADPSAQTPSASFRSEIFNTTGTTANSIRTQLFNPVLNRDLAPDSVQFLGTLNIQQLPASYWTSATVPPGQLPGIQPAGIKMQGFTDFSAFDFKNHMIDETSRQGDSFHSFNVALSQQAWHDRIGIELAYDTQRVDRRSKNGAFSAGNANHIRIDPNVTLPTGEPNPNLGRPYVIYGQSAWTNNLTERDAFRATAFLKYDFKDARSPWLRWFGRHTLTGLYEQNSVDTINYNHRVAADGPAARAIAANINSFNRIPGIVVYVGPSIIGNNNPLRLEPIRVPEVTAGTVGVPSRYFVRNGDTTDIGHFENAETKLVEINAGGSAQREVIKSQGAVLQSYWLKENLITMFGWRRDEEYFTRQSINYVANPNDPNDPGKVHYSFGDFSFPHTPPFNIGKEIKSYSAVLRWPRNLVRLPAGTDVSVHFSRSANFTPIGGRVNGFNEALQSPEGKTNEYGLNLSLFDGKLIVRVNQFETQVKNQSLSSNIYTLATVNATLLTAAAWAREGNTNPQLVDMRNADIETLFAPLPANYRDLYRWTISGAAPTISVSHLSSLPGAIDTTDYTAKGTEIDFVYNPTRNWRILANVAHQETVQTNSLPFLKEFVSRMTPAWDKLRDRAWSTYPFGWNPGDPMTNILTFGSWLDANVLVPFKTALATEGTASAEQRKWRANLVTNYEFGRDSIFGSKLKGWGIGGAIRWQDKLGIGYPTTRNADKSVNIDLAHPYYAPAETNADAWVSYHRKLWQGRIDWKIQLNVTNLYGTTSPIAVGVQPWGDISTVRLAPERRWYLTNSFEF
jgi:hypothetical protein